MKLSEYRENAARAIHIFGEIDENLVQSLTGEICRLRGESSDPITVYINSPGGSVLHAEQIRNLLKTPNQDGSICRIVTIATTRADSAAAGLLALGDYAIAYPNSTIHCHGVRLVGREITSERAERLAASLKETNDDFALKLAHRTFERMSFHFVNLKGNFANVREEYRVAKNNETELSSDLECFAFMLHRRLSPEFKGLPRSAYRQHERLVEMGSYVFGETLGFSEDDPLAKKEAALLQRLLEFELTKRDLNEWTLSQGGLNDLVLDFNAFSDYLFGPHNDMLEQHLDAFGSLFLSTEEISEYVEMTTNDPKASQQWMRDKAKPLLGPMWYFVVSLCRSLNAGEYSLSAVDAYWLGIVDEVIGEQLPSFRLIAENPDT